MDVMPMTTMSAVSSRDPGPSPRPTAKSTGRAPGDPSDDRFGAALTEAERDGADEDSPSETKAETKAATRARSDARATPERGPDTAPDADAMARAGALGISGLVVARPNASGALPNGLPAAVALTGLSGSLTPAQRGLQAGLAARGFLSLQEALRGPDAAAGGGGGDLLSRLAAGDRQDALTQELAHLLSARTGPLPDFGSTESAAPPSAPQPEMATPAATPEAAEPASTDEPPSVVAARDTARLAAGPDGEGPVDGLTGPPLGGSEGGLSGPTSMGAGSLTPTVSGPTAAPATPAPAPTYAPSTPTLPPGVEAPAVLRQIGDGLKLLAQSHRQTAEIRLDPVELGKVRIRMEIEGKDVRMYVTTENAAVRDVVAAGLDGLRRGMMAQGLLVSHVSVDVQPDARGFGQHRHDDHPEGDAATGERIGDAGAQPVGSPSRTRSPRDGKRIDLTA